MRRIARRLDPAVEPAAGVRTLAVRALAEVGGTGSLPLVRLALVDADARVRGAALDALVVVALRDRAIRRALVPLLHLHVRDADAEVRASARLGVLQAAGHTLELPPEADEAAHATAYDAWIASPAGEMALARGLDEFDTLRDRFADDVFVRYFDAPAGIVVKAAYDALCRFAASPGVAGTRADWLARRPRLEHEAFRPEALEGTRKALLAWRGSRP
jgi:hypothetical protein